MEFLPSALDTLAYSTPNPTSSYSAWPTGPTSEKPDSVTAHAGPTYERWLRTLSIPRARAVGAFISGGVAQANWYARAEALANAAESHVLDVL